MSDDTVHFFRKKFDINIVAEFERLESVGRIPINKLRDRDTLLEHLNDAMDNARKAKTLHIKAKGMFEQYMIGHTKELRALKRKATVRVRAWLEKTGVKKQITQDMVVESICELEDTRTLYEALLAKRREHKNILDACETLADKWDGRRYLLTAQANLLRAIIEVNLGGTGKRKKSPRKVDPLKKY